MTGRERLTHHFQHRHVDEALVISQLQDAEQFFQHALGGLLLALQVLQPGQRQVDGGDHFRGRGRRHHGQQVFAKLLGFFQPVLVVQYYHHARRPQGPGGAIPRGAVKVFVDKGDRFADVAKLVIGQRGNQPGITGGKMMPQPQQHVPGLAGKRQRGFQSAMLQMVVGHHGQGEGADIPVPAAFHQ